MRGRLATRQMFDTGHILVGLPVGGFVLTQGSKEAVER